MIWFRRRTIKWLAVAYLQEYITIPSSIIRLIVFYLYRAAGARKSSLRSLMAAHRYWPTDAITNVVKRHLGEITTNLALLGNEDESVGAATKRSIILKEPSLNGDQVDKGVLLITFTKTFAYYHNHIDIARLQEYFHIVLEPSWAGYCLPEVLLWANYADPVIVQSTERYDRRFLGNIETNLTPVPFGASDWVDHGMFYPLVGCRSKVYDAIYVANYAPGKRVHAFLRALRKIKKMGRPFHAALLCAGWGGQPELVDRLISLYGVRDRLDLLHGVPPQEVNTLLNKSKCNVLLSLKEGSNRSLFESMFAGTPVIALRENVGINKDYINSSTGVLIADRDLHVALLKMQANYNQYRPRDWAMEHISPEVTTRKLAAAIREATGDTLISDDSLRVKVNRPEVRYFSSADCSEEEDRRIRYNELLLNYFKKDSTYSDNEIRCHIFSEHPWGGPMCADQHP